MPGERSSDDEAGAEARAAEASGNGQADRADEFERRMTVPVLVAALASIPAVFLTRAAGTASVIGYVLNWASLGVLVGESAVLLWLSGSVRVWLRRYRWQLIVVAAAVPAVVFVVGPVQLLRLVQALYVFRARRIVRAGQVVVHRLGLGARLGRWVFAAVVVLAAVFVTIVLADPHSRSRHVVDWIVARIGLVPTILVGLAVAGAAYLVVRRTTRARRRR